MKIRGTMLRLKGFRHPREIIDYAVWGCHWFAPSTADVEDLLAERGVIVSRETIRLWVNRLGAHFAGCIRRDRPQPNDNWHLYEVVVPINSGSGKNWHIAMPSGEGGNHPIWKARSLSGPRRRTA